MARRAAHGTDRPCCKQALTILTIGGCKCHRVNARQGR